MPYLKLQTNKEIEDRKGIVSKLSRVVAEETGKPESYVMVALENRVELSLGGNHEPAVFMELKSIGLSSGQTGNISAALSQVITDYLDIPADRIYIVFASIDRKMWGWSGSTF